MDKSKTSTYDSNAQNNNNWGLITEFMVNHDDDVIIFSTITKAFAIQPLLHMVTKIIIPNYVDTHFLEYTHIF
jgi:hypothetical protein